MTRARSSVLALVSIGSAGFLAAGCGKNLNITPDTTLTQLFDQITVGDVVNAFQQFAAMSATGQLGPALTDDQRAQVEALQTSLDNGEINRQQFNDEVRKIIGVSAPNGAAVSYEMSGGPMGGHFGDRLASLLNLTADQIAAAQQIFQKAHDDIQALRVAARDAIFNVLTDEQKAELAKLAIGQFVGGPPDAAPGNAARGRGPGPGGSGPGGRGLAFDRLATALNLTDDQKTQIQQIRDKLQADVMARHEQARTDFLALLTDEQKQTLTDLQNQHSGQ